MDRTAWRQLLIAVGISTVAIVVFLTIAYYAYRSDNVLGHGPLPSSASGGGAYAITILVALLAMLSAGVTCVGITQTREFTGRFFWVPYLLVEGILVLLLLVPLRRFGVDPWGGLPTFMASMPAQLMAGVTLGFLWVPTLSVRLIPPAWRGQAATGAGGASAPRPSTRAAIRGLPGRFTPSAWRVLSHMQEAARRFEHGFMGTEHLLLGILQERQALAARTMVNVGVDLDEARSQVEGVIGRRGSLYTGSGGLTRRCRRVIEHSARLARETGRRTVGTGHLLQGLMADPEDAAGQVLESMGLTGQRLAQELRHLGYETEETDQPADS